MPSQAKPKTRREDGAAAAASNDLRFASIATDPRFRLPSARHARVGVDKRFSRMFKDEDFSRKAAVDRYGRKLKKGTAKKDLERFYKIDGDEETQKAKSRVVGSDDGSEEEEDEVADDSEVEAELERAGGARDFAREGFSSSSEDESSEEEDEDDENVVQFPDEEQADTVPMGEVSSRLAVVNLDWDNIRASDLMAVAQSFAPTSGRIARVVIYPSEFGKERMEREELEGPPRDIFSSTTRQDDLDDDVDSEEEEERIKKRLLQGDEGEEFDSAKLRQYQLDRLKYYYAVITCDSNGTAKTLYDAMDGREYLTTSNFFDMRFIPDEVSFDTDAPRDECSKLPAGYKPNEFVTEALTHSKVKLTWDADDTTRKEVQKRAFSRAEIDENDLQAYIGSDSSGSEDENDGEEKLSKAEQQRQKMRAALGLSTTSLKPSKTKKDEPVGDMQITFSSGLSGPGKKDGVFENEPLTEETTRERYVRKEKERKARRKEKAKTSRDPDAARQLEEELEAAAVDEAVTADAGQGAAADLGFDDPFFNDAPTAQKAEKAARKADKKKKREEREQQEKAAAAQRAELELLMVDDKESNMRHFDMNEIAKAEKMAKRKGKKGAKTKKNGDDGEEKEVQGQDFRMETQDPRFARLFESHEFAIDPTNPKFKGTAGMKALLEEGRKKRKNRPDEDDAGSAPLEKKEKKIKTKPVDDVDGSEDLQKLLARVKAKTKR
ncbi:hypothetical protein MBLNU459_g1979t1 [Dothideomycetes sp. NU459]